MIFCRFGLEKCVPSFKHLLRASTTMSPNGASANQEQELLTPASVFATIPGIIPGRRYFALSQAEH